jgi:hypothetical protein
MRCITFFLVLVLTIFLGGCSQHNNPTAPVVKEPPRLEKFESVGSTFHPSEDISFRLVAKPGSPDRPIESIIFEVSPSTGGFTPPQMVESNIETGEMTYAFAKIFQEGIYTVKASAIDISDLRSNSEGVTISIMSDPPLDDINHNPAITRFDHGPTDGVAPLTVRRHYEAIDPDSGDVVTHFIDFGNGVTTDVPVGEHVYASPGTYNLYYRVTDSKGGIAERFATFTVRAPETEETKTFLQVTSSPTGATVWRNGLFFGLTNTDTLEVTPGTHELLVTLAGHDTVVTSITLAEGDAKSVFVFLPEIPPLHFHETTEMVVRGDKGQAERHASHVTSNKDGVYNVEVLVTLTGNQIGENAYFYWDVYGVRYGEYLGDNQSPSDSSFYVHVGKHPVEPDQLFHLAHQNAPGGPESTHIDEIRATDSDDPNFWNNLGSSSARVVVTNMTIVKMPGS